MVEFESLLYSDPRTLAAAVLSPQSEAPLRAIRARFTTPEEINDNPNTAPSIRLAGLFAHYQKRLHGLIAAKNIGIEALRTECPHFAQWLAKLRACGAAR
jgi:hypothetical protein